MFRKSYTTVALEARLDIGMDNGRANVVTAPSKCEKTNKTHLTKKIKTTKTKPLKTKNKIK